MAKIKCKKCKDGYLELNSTELINTPEDCIIEEYNCDNFDNCDEQIHLTICLNQSRKRALEEISYSPDSITGDNW